MSTTETTRRVWRTPTVSTVECRPEVTAYSGDGGGGGPWTPGTTSGAR